MTALITVWRDGTAISCGRSCYSAKHKACRCPICGGLNHGKGPEAATAITRRHLHEWVAAAGEGAEVELDETVQQDPLFTIGDQPVTDNPNLPAFSDLVAESLALARKAAALLSAGYAQGTEPGWQRDEAKNEATRGLRQVVDALERARG